MQSHLLLSQHFRSCSKTVKILFGINMSSLHLGKGSQQPPRLEGKLRLYSMQYCPYAQRVRLVLQAKNIPHDIVNINLQEKPEWYFNNHPQGKVPAIDTGYEVLVESVDVSEYLDAKYPGRALHSKDSARKQRDRELIGKIDGYTDIYYQILSKKDEKTPQGWVEALSVYTKEFTAELVSRKTKFFGGDQPGMFDYMFWPWMERTPVLSLALGQKLPHGHEAAVLMEWYKAMLEDPAVKATYHSPEEHWKVIEKWFKNLPIDYDNL